MGRLNAVYPKIGANASTPTRVDFNRINDAATTIPTAVKSTVTTAITGAGFIAINFENDAGTVTPANLVICLD